MTMIMNYFKVGLLLALLLIVPAHDGFSSGNLHLNPPGFPINGNQGALASSDSRAPTPASHSTRLLEKYDLRQFNGLNEVVAAIGIKDAVVVISDPQPIVSDVFIPQNVQLEFIDEGRLTVASRAKIVIRGALVAGLRQIFDGSGSVVFAGATLREVYPQWFGARGNGIADDTPTLKKAFDSLSSAGGTVYLPAGTYILGTITPGANYLENILVPLRSNVSMRGAGNTTVLKLKDHILDRADDATGNAHMFGGDNIANVTIRDMKFDMNGKNNLTPAGKVRNAMAIRIGGTGGSNVRIENCEFIDCAGHNVIGIWSPHGKDVYIINNRLKNGGHYVGGPIENLHNSDFSFIVTKWKNSRVTGNIIEQENVEMALRSWSGGLELGGSGSLSSNNTFIGCDPAMYLPATTEALENLEVKDNVMRDCLRGIAFWNSYPMKNIRITDNIISLNSSPRRKDRPCIGIEQPNGSLAEFSQANANAYPIENLEIRNNTVTCNLPEGSRHPAHGIMLHSVLNGVVAGNTIDRLTSIGIFITGSPWGTTNLTIRDNKIINCGRGETITGSRAGLYLYISGASQVPAKKYSTTNLLIENNQFGNTHVDILDPAGTIIAGVCEGFQQTGISIDLVSSRPEIKNLVIRGNTFSNLPYNIYTGSGTLPLENLHPEAHFVPESIYAQTRPLKNRQLFGSEVIYYASDGIREQCTGFGYYTDKRGTISGAAGEQVLKCDSSKGLRVGMFIIIQGAGPGGASLSAYVTSINRETVTIDRKLLTSVVGTAYTVQQPTVVPLLRN